MDRPTCVVAGLGGWGRRLMARVNENFEVAALVSTGGPGSKAWSAQHYPRLPLFRDLREALEAHSIKAVFLATPTRTHAALTHQALDAGCHVFVEKPLALDAAGATRAISIARRKNLEVFVGYVYLFHGGLGFLRRCAPADQVRTLHFDWVAARLAGPLHEELLCHDLAVTVALTNELPSRVVVLDSSDRILCCRLELPSGRSCMSTIHLRDDLPKRRIVAVHYLGGASYTWHDDRVYSLDDPATDLVEGGAEDPLTREIRAFRSAIEQTRPRMVEDERLSIGIGRLLEAVSRSVGA